MLREHSHGSCYVLLGCSWRNYASPVRLLTSRQSIWAGCPKQSLVRLKSRLALRIPRVSRQHTPVQSFLEMAIPTGPTGWPDQLDRECGLSLPPIVVNPDALLLCLTTLPSCPRHAPPSSVRKGASSCPPQKIQRRSLVFATNTRLHEGWDAYHFVGCNGDDHAWPVNRDANCQH